MDDILDAVIAVTPDVIAHVGTQLPSGFPAELFDITTRRLHAAAEQLDQAPRGG